MLFISASPKTLPWWSVLLTIVFHPVTWLVIITPPLLGCMVVGAINWYIFTSTADRIFHKPEEVPVAYTGVLLGAKVFEGGGLSEMLQDRTNTAIALYNQRKIQKILVSGDHGRVNYDEVNTIRKYLLERGIPAEAIFLDHAGFDTYDSMYRAREIFEVTDAIIITQEFHLPRALYLAQARGIKAQGIVADSHVYPGLKRNQTRELLANVKAWFDITLGNQPTYLGEKIPITGDSKQSWDEL